MDRSEQEELCVLVGSKQRSCVCLVVCVCGCLCALEGALGWRLVLAAWEETKAKKA